MDSNALGRNQHFSVDPIVCVTEKRFADFLLSFFYFLPLVSYWTCASSIMKYKIYFNFQLLKRIQFHSFFVTLAYTQFTRDIKKKTKKSSTVESLSTSMNEIPHSILFLALFQNRLHSKILSKHFYCLFRNCFDWFLWILVSLNGFYEIFYWSISQFREISMKMILFQINVKLFWRFSIEAKNVEKTQRFTSTFDLIMCTR